MNDSPFDNWRKSSRSGGGSNCVEVGRSVNLVGLRDSKDPAGPVLVFGLPEWRQFIRDICDGELI